MVRREIRKNNYDRDRRFPGDGEYMGGNPDDVISLEVIRGGNTYDSNLITSIIVMYVDSTVEIITLLRGVTPPVPDSVPNHEFINNALITGFIVDVTAPYGTRRITGNIVRENGYGRVVKLDMSYS